MDQEYSSAEREAWELWGFVDQCREESRYKFEKETRDTHTSSLQSTSLLSTLSTQLSQVPTETNNKVNDNDSSISIMSRFPTGYTENFCSPLFNDTDNLSLSPEDSTIFPFPSLNNQSPTSLKKETDSNHSKEDYYDTCSNSIASTYISSPKSMPESGVLNALRSYLSNTDIQKTTPSRRFSETTLNDLETIVLSDGSTKSLEGPHFTLKYHEAIELFNLVQQRIHSQTNTCSSSDIKDQSYSSVESTTQSIPSYNDILEENSKLVQLNEKLQAAQRIWSEEKVLLLNRYNDLALSTNKTKHDLKTISSKLKNIEDRTKSSDILSFIDNLQEANEKLHLENQFLNLENRVLNKNNISTKDDSKLANQRSRKSSFSSYKSSDRTQKCPLYQQNTSSSSLKSKKNDKKYISLESIVSKTPTKTTPKKLSISVPPTEIIPGLNHSNDSLLYLKSPIYQSNPNVIYSEPIPLSPSTSLGIKSNHDALSLAKKRLIDLDSMVSIFTETVSSFSQTSEKHLGIDVEQNLINGESLDFEHSSSSTQLVNLERVVHFCDVLISNTSEFNRLIEAEKRFFDLQIAYEKLENTFEASKSVLNKRISQFEETKLFHKKQMKTLQEKITCLFQENTRLETESEASRKNLSSRFSPTSSLHNVSLCSKSPLHRLRNSLEPKHLGLESQYWADQFQKLEYQYLQSVKKITWLEEENYYLESRLIEAQAMRSRYSHQSRNI